MPGLLGICQTGAHKARNPKLCQPGFETSLLGGFCTASCWKVTVKTARFSAVWWLAIVSESVNLVPEEGPHAGSL